MDILRKRPGVSCRIHCEGTIWPYPQKVRSSWRDISPTVCEIHVCEIWFWQIFYQEMNGNESICATHWDCFICSSSPALPRFFTFRAWRGLPPKWQPKQWIKSRTLPCKGQGGWEPGCDGWSGPWMRTMTTGTIDIHGFSAYKKRGGLNRVL